MTLSAERVVRRRCLNLLDDLIVCATRSRGLEKALIARAVLDPFALRDAGVVYVSPPTAFLLNLILSDPVAASAGLAEAADVALRFDQAVSDEPPDYGETIRLARDVAAIGVGELAQVGSLTHVVDLLNSCRYETSQRAAA